MNDQRYIMLNGDLIEAGAARISPLGEGFMYGLGLFETIRVLRGRPAFFSEHFERLRRSAAELGLAFVAVVDELRARCERCAAANGLAEGGLKVILFKDTSGMGELITARASLYLSEHYERGFRLKTVSVAREREGYFHLKTLNYLENLRAKRVAQAAGCDEALFVDADGSILEGSMSNIFLAKNGEVFTPSLDGRILPGIARGQVLRILKSVRVSEGVIPAKILFEAEEVFVTNALLGVMPVAVVDEKRYGLDRNSVTKSIAEAYRKLQAQSVGDPA